jgi:outer membrane protein assembly factor BamB
MLLLYSIPALSLALVGSVAISRGRSSGVRRGSMIAAIVIACAAMTLIRTNGVTGDSDSDIRWRWTQSPEERLLATAAAPATAPVPAPTPPVAAAGTPASPETKPPDARGVEPPREVADATPRTTSESPARPAGGDSVAAWPGFRGAGRDGIVRGTKIETDWSRTPPVQLWRRPVGPGWSSFAVGADLIYTQEQRGEEELVSAYRLSTGEPVWSHRDAARFWESNAGAGPRGTPTLSRDRIYTVGGTGIVNALNARDGSVIWSRNVASDTGRAVPDWGIASSPLVVGDAVIVAAAGSLAAYDAATGNPRWFGPKDGGGYSSPQLSIIDGVSQIVLLNGAGAISVAPSDGALLWRYNWPSDGIVQPASIAGGGLLIGSGSGLAGNTGMLRVAVGHDTGSWRVEERWTSTGLKPYFNDFVVHAGHAFGFDGSILACIDLQDGARKWKGGRYGHGQLLAFADQGILLVLSEDGELALVSATPDKFTELARVPALDGKTWNHPVLAGDVLLVRNGEEMAAFRLSLAGR